LNQDSIRERCIAYIEKYGSRQTFFCKKLAVSRTHFSLWLRGERDMSDERLDALNKILAN